MLFLSMFRRKRNPVHFVFEAHSPEQEYRKGKLPRNIKTIVFELYKGWPKGQPLTEEIVNKFPSDTRFEKTRKEFFLKALKESRRFVAGETVTLAEKKRLMLLEGREFMRWTYAFFEPSLKDIQKYFVAKARNNRFRHELIKKTIKELIEKKVIPLEARYGTTHSLLSMELRKQGIESSRTIKPQVFLPQEILLRKLTLGIKASQIKPVEYKKAFADLISHTNEKMNEIIAGKKYEKWTEKDTRFFSLVETTLLNKLSEPQIDEIIKTRNPGLMFEFNGLPNPLKEQIPHIEFRKKLIEFLNKNSSFQRRQQSHIKNIKEKEKIEKSLLMRKDFNSK